MDVLFSFNSWFKHLKGFLETILDIHGGEPPFPYWIILSLRTAYGRIFTLRVVDSF